jgi:hypothetical protein
MVLDFSPTGAHLQCVLCYNCIATQLGRICNASAGAMASRGIASEQKPKNFLSLLRKAKKQLIAKRI